MAVTFLQQPNAITSAGNAMVFVFSSDNAGEENFSFKVVTSVNSAVIDTSRVFVKTNNSAHFDVSEIVQRNLARLLPMLDDTPYTQTLSVNVDVAVYENYGTTPIDEDSANSNTIFAINSSFSNSEWLKVDLEDYADTRFLTDAPERTILAIKNQPLQLSIIEQVGQTDITINLLDANGNLIDSAGQQINIGEDCILHWNISKKAIEDYSELDMTNVASLEIYNSNTASMIVKYTGECEEEHALIWLNKYGVFDSYAFTHNLEKDTTTTSETYTKQFGSWEGGVYGFNPLTSGNQSYVKILEDGGTLTSGVLTEAVYNWLITVIESPQVFLCDKDGNLELIRITTSKLSEYQARFEDDVPQLTIDFKFANGRKSVKI